MFEPPNISLEGFWGFQTPPQQVVGRFGRLEILKLGNLLRCSGENKHTKTFKPAPNKNDWPIFGALHHLQLYTVPFVVLGFAQQTPGR